MPTNPLAPLDMSEEAVAQRLAREDEVARLMHQHLLAASHIHGEAAGYAKSYLEAFTEVLDKEAMGEAAFEAALVHAHCAVIAKICGILGVGFDQSKAERLKTLKISQLVEVEQSLLERDYWPVWMHRHEE